MGTTWLCLSADKHFGDDPRGYAETPPGSGRRDILAAVAMPFPWATVLPRKNVEVSSLPPVYKEAQAFRIQRL